MKTKDITTARYFGCTIKVMKMAEFDSHPYPWRYEIITPTGKHLHFSGIPNQLETRRAALKKAWWRAKWISEGTFEKKYTSHG